MNIHHSLYLTERKQPSVTYRL